MNDLAGRTVLVTGSTHGIGREVAITLAAAGACVAVHGRSREAADEVAAVPAHDDRHAIHWLVSTQAERRPGLSHAPITPFTLANPSDRDRSGQSGVRSWQRSKRCLAPPEHKRPPGDDTTPRTPLRARSPVAI